MKKSDGRKYKEEITIKKLLMPTNNLNFEVIQSNVLHKLFPQIHTN